MTQKRSSAQKRETGEKEIGDSYLNCGPCFIVTEQNQRDVLTTSVGKVLERSRREVELKSGGHHVHVLFLFHQSKSCWRHCIFS